MKNNCQEMSFCETVFPARRKLISTIKNKNVKIQTQTFPTFAFVLKTRSQLTSRLIVKVAEIRIEVRDLNTILRYVN
jgi:hypothetical protein